MFDKYIKVTYTALFLLYVITPLYIFFVSSSSFDYFIAILILTMGFGLHFILENRNNKKLQEFLAKWF